MRRTFLIIATATLIIFVGLLFLLIMREDKPSTQPSPNTSPFGSGDNINLPNTNTPDVVKPETTETLEMLSKKSLFRLSNEPVAGYGITAKATTTIIRYVDRATGHVVDINPVTLEKTLVNNSTRPRVYEAFIDSSGNKILFRLLKEDGDAIENISVALAAPKGTSTSDLYTASALALRSDIDEVVVASSTLFYTVPGGIVGSEFDGSKLKNILDIKFDG